MPIIFLYVILSLSFTSIMYQGVRPIHGIIVKKDHFFVKDWTLLDRTFTKEIYGIEIEEANPSVSHWLQGSVRKRVYKKEKWDRFNVGDRVKGNRMFGFNIEMTEP